MLLLIGALLISTKLVQKAQDTRSSAASCTYGSKKCFGNYLGTCKQTSTHTYWSKSPCRYGCANNKCKIDPAKVKNVPGKTTKTEGLLQNEPIKTETPVSDVKVICTSFTYSAWSTCSNGKQTRRVTSKSPSGCTGGGPVTSRSCTVPTCTSFTYSSWSICTNGKQTRKVTGASPSGCAGGSPKTTQSCSSVGSSTNQNHGGGSGAGF